jgi:hypothetical protein
MIRDEGPQLINLGSSHVSHFLTIFVYVECWSHLSRKQGRATAQQAQQAGQQLTHCLRLYNMRWMNNDSYSRSITIKSKLRTLLSPRV